MSLIVVEWICLEFSLNLHHLMKTFSDRPTFIYILDSMKFKNVYTILNFAYLGLHRSQKI